MWTNNIKRVNIFVDIDKEIKKMKIKRRLKFGDEENDSHNAPKNYVNSLIARSLCALILFFICIILLNTNKITSEFIRENILTENISYTKIGNVYNKFFGNILPFEKILKDEAVSVFKENLSYEKIDQYKDGFALSVAKNYTVPIVETGVVVFIGEKDDLGKTVIIQGIDEIDYWYSNLSEVSLSLYDFVNKGNILGSVDGNKLYMTFKKDGEFLDFDEVIK